MHIHIIIIYRMTWAPYNGRRYIRGRLGRIVARARGRGLHGDHIAGLMIAGMQGDGVGGVMISGVCGSPCAKGSAKLNGETVGLHRHRTKHGTRARCGIIITIKQWHATLKQAEKGAKMLKTGNGTHTRGAKYKMTRKKNALVVHYGALNIVNTEDEEREGWDYIDIVYAGTDYGIQYYHTPREEYLKALEVCEAYAMGYNQALDDMQK